MSAHFDLIPHKDGFKSLFVVHFYALSHPISVMVHFRHDSFKAGSMQGTQAGTWLTVFRKPPQGQLGQVLCAHLAAPVAA